jgi:hypothetical protein
MNWIIIDEDTKVLEHNICSVQKVSINSIQKPTPPPPIFRDPNSTARLNKYYLAHKNFEDNNIVSSAYQITMVDGSVWVSPYDPAQSDII